MSDEFQRDEQRILQVLEGAGWERTQQSIQLGTASLTHDGPGMRLDVEQQYGERELIVTLAAPNGTELTLFIDYGDHLDEVLQAVVVSQDSITSENFREHTRQWLAVCPSIYVQQDENAEPRLLSAD